MIHLLISPNYCIETTGKTKEKSSSSEQNGLFSSIVYKGRKSVMEYHMFSDLQFGDVIHVPMGEDKKRGVLSFLYCGKDKNRLLGLRLHPETDEEGSRVESVSLEKVYRLKADKVQHYEARLVSTEAKDLILRSLVKERPEGISLISIRTNILPRKNDFVCFQGRPYYLKSVVSDSAFLYPISECELVGSSFPYLGKDHHVFYIHTKDAISVPYEDIGFLEENSESLKRSIEIFSEQENIHFRDIVQPYSYVELSQDAKDYRKEILSYSLRPIYPLALKDRFPEIVRNYLFSLRAGLESGLIYNGESS